MVETSGRSPPHDDDHLVVVVAGGGHDGGHEHWRRKGGALGAIAPPLEVSWDLFFGVSQFCSFKTVDLTSLF